ncbi:MAG: ADOP family duplicated permease, partial [Blastocatellia bacterium]
DVFSRDEAIIGKRIEINQTPFTVIGVMSAEFRDLEALDRPAIDMWIPLGLSQQLAGNRFDTRTGRVLWGVARLKPGVTLAAAKAETALIGERIAQANPATDKGFGLFVESLRGHFYRDLYSPVALLLGGAGLVLLIGCVNVANLLLARVAGRRREMAVRAAMGATRVRLMRQLLVESALLSGAAGLFGLLLAAWASRLLNAWDALRLPGFVEIRLNGWALGASLLLSLLTGLLFGLAPAWESARADLRGALNQTSRQSANFERSLKRRLLIVAEVSLSFILLISAGLMLRSVYTLLNTGLGFRTENLLTLRMDLNGERYAREEARAQFAQGVIEKARALPGVESATLWGPAPLGRATWVMFAAPEGKPINGQEDWTMAWRHATNPGGLNNLGLPLLRGRDFTSQDTATTTTVTIISESLAQRFWPNEDAIGKRFARQSQTGQTLLTVIGVAADAKHRTRYLPQAGASWAFQPQLDIYQPYTQRANPILVVALRIGSASANALPAFRQAVLSLDPNMTFYDVTTLDQRLTEQSGTLRAIATLMTLYAAVALFLAALGIYGVLSHAVTQRTQEIGIRMALGARRREILRLIVGQGFWLVVTGCVIGLTASLLLTRLLANLVFGVSVTDPQTLGGVALLLSGVALLACYLPARRATKVDPVIALRQE